MDREWIRDKLLRAGTEVTDESSDECDAVWLTIPRPSVDALADTIFQAHEEECRAGSFDTPARRATQDAARRSQEAVLPCGHHASNAVIGEDGKARCEMCELQAQVVRMAEGLEQIRGYAELRHTALSSEVLISGMVTISEFCEKALSDAPKVAWHGRDIGAIPLSFGQERVDIYICSRPPEQGQESEQGYKLARGVIPWHEGDEPPEDTIARIRGREQEREQ